MDDELLSKLTALNVFSPLGDPLNQAESSTWAEGRPASSKPKSSCVGCGDEHHFFDVARWPCSHEYCRACLAELFKTSLTDESLFPPRCCSQAIPVESNRAFLPPKLVGEFLAKKAETETPDKTYCHQPTCSTFIPKQSIQGDVGTCVRCQVTTCVTCKSSSHEAECPQDDAVQELLRLAAKNGWQRCYSCHRLVELEHGCYHMSASCTGWTQWIHADFWIACRCRAEFCYLCGLRWQTCQCKFWDPPRLLARANTVVDRDANARQLGDAERAHLVDRARHNLIQNHECHHINWTSRPGEHLCEGCNVTLPIFIYECLRCGIMACRRCRYNRL